MAQHHHARRAAHLRLVEVSPEYRLHAEGGKETVRYPHGDQVFRPLRVHQLQILARVKGDAIERLAIACQFEEEGGGQRKLGILVARFEHPHQPLGLGVRQWLQEHAVNEGEDHRVDRHGEHQRRDGDRGEASLP